MKAKLRWYVNHEPEEKKKFLLQLEGSHLVLDRLKEILKEMYDESLRECEHEPAYSMPSWSEYQAHHIGKRSVLREVIQLVTLTED